MRGLRWGWLPALGLALAAGCQPSDGTLKANIRQIHLTEGFDKHVVDVNCDNQRLFSGRVNVGARQSGPVFDVPASAGQRPDVRISVNGRWFNPPLHFDEGRHAELRYVAAGGGQLDSRMVNECLATNRPAALAAQPTASTPPASAAPAYVAPAPAYAPPRGATDPVFIPADPIRGERRVVIPETPREGDPVPVRDVVYGPAQPAPAPSGYGY